MVLHKRPVVASLPAVHEGTSKGRVDTKIYPVLKGGSRMKLPKFNLWERQRFSPAERCTRCPRKCRNLWVSTWTRFNADGMVCYVGAQQLCDLCYIQRLQFLLRKGSFSIGRVERN